LRLPDLYDLLRAFGHQGSGNRLTHSCRLRLPDKACPRVSLPCAGLAASGAHSMTAIIDRLAEGMHGPAGYVLLGVCACLENIIPPVPGDTVTVIGGYLSGIGVLSLPGVITATTLGNFAGFMLLYMLGRTLGKRFFMEDNRHVFARHRFATVLHWFEKYGYMVVLCNRFLSGIRSIISLCAGIARLHPLKVSVYCLASCLLWNLLLVMAGNKVGRNWESITDITRRYNLAVAAVVVLVIAVCLLLKKGPFSNGFFSQR
jgi:membrane protein DedA with SNARE-associated domain